MENFYQILGVKMDASPAQIESAYRAAAGQCHPDKNPGDTLGAKKRFQKLQEAYETLRDPVSRFYYNRQHCRLKGDWFLVPIGAPLGPFQFNADGSFLVLQQRFEQQAACDILLASSALGSLQVSKAAGAGQPVLVATSDDSLRFQFRQERWLCWSQQASASPPGDSESGQRAWASESYSLVPAKKHALPPPLPPNPSSPPPSSGATFSVPSLLKWPAAIAALVLAVAGGWLLNSLQRPHPETVLADLKAREAQIEIEKRQKAIDAREAAEREADAEKARVGKAKDEQRKLDQARTKERLRSIINLGEVVTKQHATMLAEKDAWDKLFPALLTNEQGRKLAAREDYVRTYQVEQEKLRPSNDELVAMRGEIEVLLQPIREAEASAAPAYSPPNDIDARLQQKLGQIDGIAAGFRRSRQLIEGLLAASSISANMTLTEKLNAIATEDAKKQAEAIDRETAAARKQLVAIKARTEAEKADAEVRTQELAAQAKKEEATAQLQHDKDVQEAKSGKVQKALAFFTAKGYYQPYQGNGATSLEKTAEAKPISLSRLRTINALDKSSTQSLQYLHFLISSNYDEARPSWPPAQSIAGLSARQTDELKQIQDYLDRLGPVLVELKMLSP